MALMGLKDVRSGFRGGVRFTIDVNVMGNTWGEVWWVGWYWGNDLGFGWEGFLDEFPWCASGFGGPSLWVGYGGSVGYRKGADGVHAEALED